MGHTLSYKGALDTTAGICDSDFYSTDHYKASTATHTHTHTVC